MPARCYLIPEILGLLQMSATDFKRKRAAGTLPFLQELRPRLGRRPRYLAAPIDDYLSGTFGRPHLAFGRKRRA